jgi:hypothetical protein
VPDGEDFITWFLTESKSGNAVYYATTAVMAYRAAGYPARYVEGYRISDKIASAMELIGENTITLTNQNAHAWVEVYVSGVGWMPVEVVPGMYVESYTTQLVEGQPIYKVNAASVAEEGLELTDSNGGGDGVQPDAEPEENGSLMIPARILALLYGLFFLYLLLELQRWLRICIRRRKTRKLDEEGRVALYARQLMKTLRYGGVEGNYNHPLELTDQVVAQFPGVRAWAYERAVGLVQKVRFGCKPLQPHERHALTGTLATMRQALYSSASFLKRLRLRYQYAVEKTCI